MEIKSLLSGESASYTSLSEPLMTDGTMALQLNHQNQSPPPQGVKPNTTESRLIAKTVTFEYLLNETSQQRARLPMRVNIFPHDGTESIIATVKNFYGLYDGNGVSFEDKDGNTLIARYENFADRQTVHVRVVDDIGSNGGTPSHTTSPRRPRLGPAFELSQAHGIGQSISRPSSRTTKKRSASPASVAGHRSHSVSTIKSRQKKSRMGSVPGDDYDSDSDVGNASVTSSRRGKVDVVASAEISVENIVEGGRRKRARFDSSELPLFVPSQVPLPGSVSSVSPQRKIAPNTTASPYQYSNQAFSYSLLPSPQSFGQPDGRSFPSNQYTVRGRNGFYSGRPSISGPGGILPTPDPTVGSVISDEDVAFQLMRLGDASNYSTHGRTSTSTIDDALSGKAAASSSEESDDDSIVDDEDLPTGHVTDYSGDEYEDNFDMSFRGESDGLLGDEMYRQIKKARTSLKNGKSDKARKWKVKTGTVPLSPSSLSAQNLKPGSAPNLNFQHFQQPMADDEEDLSTKPRCQRCRKSKKGCDRQRPCGRCKDAGIGADGCVSEDEGNGRKGRYGRHMGVPIKKLDDNTVMTEVLVQPMIASSGHTMMAPPPPMMNDKNKKRKR